MGDHASDGATSHRAKFFGALRTRSDDLRKHNRVFANLHGPDWRLVLQRDTAMRFATVNAIRGRKTVTRRQPSSGALVNRFRWPVAEYEAGFIFAHARTSPCADLALAGVGIDAAGRRELFATDRLPPYVRAPVSGLGYVGEPSWPRLFWAGLPAVYYRRLLSPPERKRAALVDLGTRHVGDAAELGDVHYLCVWRPRRIDPHVYHVDLRARVTQRVPAPT
jgi:hypothetical protein